MAKKSFFGKLMGSDGMIQQGQDQAGSQHVFHDQAQAMNSEANDFEAEDITQSAMEVEEQNDFRDQRDENDEWLSEYEGELNIDMYQTKDNVIIKSTIAGVKPEDLDITIANDMLT